MRMHARTRTRTHNTQHTHLVRRRAPAAYTTYKRAPTHPVTTYAFGRPSKQTNTQNLYGTHINTVVSNACMHVHVPGRSSIKFNPCDSASYKDSFTSTTQKLRSVRACVRACLCSSCTTHRHTPTSSECPLPNKTLGCLAYERVGDVITHHA